MLTLLLRLQISSCAIHTEVIRADKGGENCTVHYLCKISTDYFLCSEKGFGSHH